MPDRIEAKPPWTAVPPRLRSEVTRLLGSPVVRARRTYGGYGPSATFVLTLADGRRTFFKGTYPLPEDSAVRWSLGREEAVYRRLGHVIEPWAPTYLGSVRADGWHALLLESVGGVPGLPWTRAKARRAIRSYAAFHASTLGRPLPAWLSRTSHRELAGLLRRIAGDYVALGRLSALAGDRRGEARDWLQRSTGALRRAEGALRLAAEPYALLHLDTRSDNIRLEGDLLRIFDWPFAAVGPAELDVAAFAQSIEAEEGPPSEVVTCWYEDVLALRSDVLTGSVVGIAGFFADLAPRPPEPGLPRLRSIQRRQLKASLRWASRRLDLPDPAWLAAVPR